MTPHAGQQANEEYPVRADPAAWHSKAAPKACARTPTLRVCNWLSSVSFLNGQRMLSAPTRSCIVQRECRPGGVARDSNLHVRLHLLSPSAHRHDMPELIAAGRSGLCDGSEQLAAPHTPRSIGSLADVVGVR